MSPEPQPKIKSVRRWLRTEWGLGFRNTATGVVYTDNDRPVFVPGEIAMHRRTDSGDVEIKLFMRAQDGGPLLLESDGEWVSIDEPLPELNYLSTPCCDYGVLGRVESIWWEGEALTCSCGDTGWVLVDIEHEDGPLAYICMDDTPAEDGGNQPPKGGE